MTHPTTVVLLLLITTSALTISPTTGLTWDEYTTLLDTGDAHLTASDIPSALATYALLPALTPSSPYAFRRHANLALAYASSGQYEEADVHAGAAAALNGTLDLAFLSGFLSLSLNRPHDAIATLSHALEADPARGKGWLFLGDAHLAVEALPQAKKAYAKAWRLLRSRKALQSLGFAYRALGKPHLETMLYASAVKEGILTDPRQRPDSLTPGLEGRPWWVTLGMDHKEREPVFNFVPLLEEALSSIQAELAALLNDDPALQGPMFHKVGTEGKFSHDRDLYKKSGKVWHQVVLSEHGVPGPGAEKAFANTLKILRSVAPAALDFGRAVISIIEPGVVIVPHCGPMNERLTVHCGLDIPSHVPVPPTITVGGVSSPWEQGKCIVFDDSFEHEVSYPLEPNAGASATRRAILLFHMPHPDILAATADEQAQDDEEWLRLQFGEL